MLTQFTFELIFHHYSKYIKATEKSQWSTSLVNEVRKKPLGTPIPSSMNEVKWSLTAVLILLFHLTDKFVKSHVSVGWGEFGLPWLTFWSRTCVRSKIFIYLYGIKVRSMCIRRVVKSISVESMVEPHSN